MKSIVFSALLSLSTMFVNIILPEYIKRMLVVYRKYVYALGEIRWKQPNSRNCKKGHAKTSLRGEPNGKPNVCS